MIPFEDLDIGVARSWLKGYARKVCPSSLSPDDLESEGLLAMWQAYQKRGEAKGSLDSFLIQAAKWQILRVLERRMWTGQEKTRAPRGRNSTGLIHADMVEQSYPDDVIRDWVATGVPEQGYERVEISDLRTVVRAAVAELPEGQRERVVRKWWGEESVPLSGNWWRDSRWGAKARLRQRLEHLDF